MKNTIYILFSLVLIAMTSCESVLLHEEPLTDNKSIFNEYSKLVNEKYAMLEFKNVDIDFLQDSIGATITESLSQEDLFAKLGYITQQLKDGHSSLISLDNENLWAGNDSHEGYPPGVHLDILIDNYLSKDLGTNLRLFEGGDLGFKAIYGLLANKDIGYIYIPSFDVSISTEELDSMFIAVKDTKGLIIDVRGNGGGDPSLSTTIASYLTDTEIYCGFERFKVGPGKNDFSDSQVYLQPTDSPNKYLKPIAVLTDRGCYSATTTFAYSIFPLDHVKFYGQRTGGGSGSVADGFLANGWKWSLSTSEFIDHLGRHLDNGFEPHFPILLDTTNNIDEVMEKAILDLK